MQVAHGEDEPVPLPQSQLLPQHQRHRLQQQRQYQQEEPQRQHQQPQAPSPSPFQHQRQGQTPDDRHHHARSSSPSPSPSPSRSASPSPQYTALALPLQLQRGKLTQTCLYHPRSPLALPWSLSALMASLDVDQRFLGQLAKNVATDNSFLSSMLFKVLGLSIILSKKLIRARKLRKLDTTRDTKSLQLYHHIIWLSREGLVIIEQYAIPMVANYTDLKVLCFKLRASFYHIFVLFHNSPPATQASLAVQNAAQVDSEASTRSSRDRLEASMTRHARGPVTSQLPPGLAPVAIPKPTSSFLLPVMDYIPQATQCFEEAAKMSHQLLSGSHPLRLSVKLEYAAFVYDCLRDGDGSRRIAKKAIADVYNAQEGMDDQMFQDAAELVGILGRMTKRGLNSTPGSSRDPRSSSTSQSRTAPTSTAPTSNGGPPFVPSSGMDNPI